MSYALSCIAVFVTTYTLNLFYISVLYHRGLAHGAVRLMPWTKALAIHTGSWVTGIDPKSWACMHRLHHLHSDTDQDPHSPVHLGVLGVLKGQLQSYERTIRNLIARREAETSLVRDLKFPVNVLNRRRIWYLPYLFHAVLALGIGYFLQAWVLALCYWLGIMSHPIQGWMVNALGHHFGYRNFETPDHSKNNLWVAWLVMGEGFQNNHHHEPQSAKFSVEWWELDLGYFLCRIAAALHLLEIVRKPRASRALNRSAS